MKCPECELKQRMKKCDDCGKEFDPDPLRNFKQKLPPNSEQKGPWYPRRGPGMGPGPQDYILCSQHKEL